MELPVIAIERTNRLHIFLLTVSDSTQPEKMLQFENYRWSDISTPIKVDQLQIILRDAGYDPIKSKKLIDGFRNGFDIGYHGPTDRRDMSRNIPLMIGTPTQLWNKVIKEVQLNRYTGPYHIEDLPFHFFMQSPIGLVPKAGGKLRLIFHLSYDFADDRRSFNHHIPQQYCSVKYNDLDHAMANCLKLLELAKSYSPTLVFAKTDASSAFRVLLVSPSQHKFLVLMAKNPETGLKQYFIEMCLPFGASISCVLYQEFSDALRFAVQHRLTTKLIMPIALTNYLDDFLFMALSIELCNGAVKEFQWMCRIIGCPLAIEKTELGCDWIVFLGILLDGKNKMLSIPTEKITKALNLLNWALAKKKVTVKFIQKLTGTLNFLNRAIVLGRVFTREMYCKLKLRSSQDKMLKPYHHVWLNKEFLLDCKMWQTFLANATSQHLCRPFIDFTAGSSASKILDFFSDASLNKKLGMGAHFNNCWIVQAWPANFVSDCRPNIKFLELFALVAKVLTWTKLTELRNGRFTFFVIMNRLSIWFTTLHLHATNA